MFKRNKISLTDCPDNLTPIKMDIKVVSNFDLEESLYEAKMRCEWFINGYGLHGLTAEEFKYLSTNRLCELYNIDISYFKKY